MSHLVTIETKVHDAAALVAACHRLGLAEPVHSNVRLYSADATGLAVLSWFNQKWKIALYELDTGNRDVRSG